MQRLLLATITAAALGTPAPQPPPPPVSGQGPLAELSAQTLQGASITAPKRLKTVKPKWPANARRAGLSGIEQAFIQKIEGIVELEIVIDANGRVVHARVVKSIPLLDSAAVQCVYAWEFSPAMKNGHPVATRANAPVVFRIF